MIDWIYEDRSVVDNDIEHWFGFVYLITNLVTGKKYVGKKLLTKAARRVVKKRKKKVRIASDWKIYYGSNKLLKEDVSKLGVDNFRREILMFCRTRGSCSYHEAKEQLARDVLRSDEYYNDWVQCKVHRIHVKD